MVNNVISKIDNLTVTSLQEVYEDMDKGEHATIYESIIKDGLQCVLEAKTVKLLDLSIKSPRFMNPPRYMWTECETPRFVKLWQDSCMRLGVSLEPLKLLNFTTDE